jgi:hypothetical protein
MQQVQVRAFGDDPLKADRVRFCAHTQRKVGPKLDASDLDS